MTYRVHPTKTALDDVTLIGSWIVAQSAPAEASDWVDRLMAALCSLEVMPERCPPAPETSECDVEIRQLLFGDYRVLLTIRDKDAFALHIRHGSRRHAMLQDLAAALAESPKTS